ncbi:hypothetical protein NBO_6g0072, partial [Nosema bombycis CQ1]
MLDLRFRNERLDGFQMFLTDMLKLVKLADYDEVEMWVFRTALKEEAEAWISDVITINCKDGLNWDEVYGICERLQISQGEEMFSEQNNAGDSMINRVREQGQSRQD